MCAFVFHLFARLQDAQSFFGEQENLLSIRRKPEAGNAVAQRLDFELLEIVGLQDAFRSGRLGRPLLHQRALHRYAEPHRLLFQSRDRPISPLGHRKRQDTARDPVEVDFDLLLVLAFVLVRAAVFLFICGRFQEGRRRVLSQGDKTGKRGLRERQFKLHGVIDRIEHAV